MLPESLAADPIAGVVEDRFPSAIIEASNAFGELGLVVEPAQLIAVCAFLRSELSFERLSAVTAVDWWPKRAAFRGGLPPTFHQEQQPFEVEIAGCRPRRRRFGD